MIRRQRNDTTDPPRPADFAEVRALLFDRRRFLIAAAGGSVALLFGLTRSHAAAAHDPWPTLDAVTRHLLPSEPDSPGAAEIHALDYLRFVVNDTWIEASDRAFILKGSQWLDELAAERQARPFTELDVDQREQILRQIAATPAGENWLSTLISYLFEALLSAPAYGGNPDGIGWRWLEYVPGFPLPDVGTRYPELPL